MVKFTPQEVYDMMDTLALIYFNENYFIVYNKEKSTINTYYTFKNVLLSTNKNINSYFLQRIKEVEDKLLQITSSEDINTFNTFFQNIFSVSIDYAKFLFYTSSSKDSNPNRAKYESYILLNCPFLEK